MIRRHVANVALISLAVLYLTGLMLAVAVAMSVTVPLGCS